MTRLVLIRSGLLSLSLVLVAASLWLAQVDWSSTSLGLGSLSIIQYTGLAVAMLGYWVYGPQSNDWRDYKALIGVAVVVRLLLVPVSPYTSNDVERYLFDGKVALEGLDPYRTAHNHPAVAHLHQDWPTPPEHAKYPTLYPPGAIALYAGVAATGHDYAHSSWKVVTSAASLGLLWVMVVLLSQIKKLRHLSLVALSPLLILETGVGAHVDIFSALAIASALLLYQRGRLLSTGLALGIGALLKLLPILLLLPLCFSQLSLSKPIFSQPAMKRFFTLGLSAVTVFSCGYLLAFSLGMHPIGSTPTFFEKWRNASPLFEVLNYYLQGDILAYIIAGLIIAILVSVAVASWKQSRHNLSNLVGLMQVAIAAPLLLSPVVFPWYLLPLAVLFALRPNFFIGSWLLLLPMSYEVLNQFACCGHWAPQLWPVYLLGLGLIAGFVIDRLRSFQKTQGSTYA